jgi:hypothetical protein
MEMPFISCCIYPRRAGIGERQVVVSTGIMDTRRAPWLAEALSRTS